MNNYHQTVMNKEAVAALKVKDHGIYVDATLGGGSHTKTLLESNETIKVYAFDQDKEAISYNKPLLEKFGERLKMFNENFVHFRSWLALERITLIDGILFDLGVSKHQIATASRGMSFDLEGNLDMRMDQNSDAVNKKQELTAEEIINTYPVKKLTEIFREFGEEKEAYSIAKAINKQRQYKTIKTTRELAEIIDTATRSPYKIKSKARIFQAIRIYINGEIEVLKTALDDAVQIIKPQGRIVVISYHSLEDRIVKRTFVEAAKDCVCPSNFPKCVCDKKAFVKIITKRPITPREEEIAENRSAKSAKMRVAEGLDDPEKASLNNQETKIR